MNLDRYLNSLEGMMNTAQGSMTFNIVVTVISLILAAVSVAVLIVIAVQLCKLNKSKVMVKFTEKVTNKEGKEQ